MIAVLVLASIAGGINPCALLETQDIARILGWTVAAGTQRSYTLPGGAGKMCTFEGREGTVMVTIPSKGTGLPVNDLTSDLGAVHTPMHDADGAGPPLELGPGTAIVHARGHDYGITAQPIDAQFADETQMRALATALVRHLPRRNSEHAELHEKKRPRYVAGGNRFARPHPQWATRAYARDAFLVFAHNLRPFGARSIDAIRAGKRESCADDHRRCTFGDGSSSRLSRSASFS